ncbi:MAG: tRNA (adenosine(37)-N6)-threonylcarbamoyltransferase complex dimerization subunit type 1 TsaB [Acidobacteria bacterium]|nr:MAG: tRNA (adenosine(37)-N6)-threonylcarbamoyltransferase complex dimerization subunit type 1 TsaB [Acidobacteriota bacterium]
MLILGIDTSGRQGSVALLRAQGEQLLALDVAEISGGRYSELLIPTIAELFARHNVERSAIGLIAVASGPGSFTGLRVAIASVKGLAEAFATPVVAVSVLEAIAFASGAQGKVMAVLDAQRSEVFFGEYDVNSESLDSGKMHREGLVSFGDFTSLLAATDPRPPVFTSDPDLAARLREAAFDAQVLPRPSAETFSRIAHRKFLAGVRVDVATLDANYMRRSDAEVLAASRAASESVPKAAHQQGGASL